MAATLARKRVAVIDRARNSRRNNGRARLVDELVIAFFVAMAAMWVVTTIAGIFV